MLVTEAKVRGVKMISRYLGREGTGRVEAG